MSVVANPSVIGRFAAGDGRTRKAPGAAPFGRHGA